MRFQPESPHLVPWVTVTDFGCAKAGKGWQGKDGPGWSKMISFQVRSDLRFCSCHESRRQVQDDIEFVCGDPRYQSPETLRALIAHLKGNATASLDRIWDLQNSKNWDLQT